MVSVTNNLTNTINFKGIPTSDSLVKDLSTKSKLAAKGLKVYENEKHFAKVRFTQDLIVNWVPKIPFSRSIADFADMSFLELSENFLVYFGGKVLNDNVFKKIVMRKAPEKLIENVKTPAVELMADKNSAQNKEAIAKKAALAVCGLTIPLAEYALSYVKNIFTLKVFKEADFNNIANLNKNKTEDPEKQKQVKESAKKHIKIAGGIFAGCMGLAALIATKGKNSKSLQSFSELILAPGTKMFKKGSKAEKNINKYFGLDSSKLTRGQLVTCVMAGFVGYCGAAKDRGKQNLLEVLSRFPLVGFYVVTGSEMFEAGFKKLLVKKGQCKELFAEEAKNIKINAEKIKSGKKDLIEHEMPQFSDLNKIAYDLHVKNGTSAEAEFKKLLSQKLTLIGVPLLFSLTVMGFFVAGMTRFFTQYRYNQEQKKLSEGQKSL